MSVDLPTLGKPSRPASASRRSSRRSVRSLAGRAGLRRGAVPVGRGGEVHVAAAASPAARHDRPRRPRRRRSAMDSPVVRVVHDRAGRHAQRRGPRRVRRTGPCRGRARRAPRARCWWIGEVEQRGQARVDPRTTSPPSPPSPPFGPPRRHVLLAPEADAAGAAVARLDADAGPRRRTSCSSTMVAAGQARPTMTLVRPRSADRRGPAVRGYACGRGPRQLDAHPACGPCPSART